MSGYILKAFHPKKKSLQSPEDFVEQKNLV